MTTRRRNIRTQMEQELAAEEAVQEDQPQEISPVSAITAMPANLQGRLRSVSPLSSSQKAIRSTDAYTKVTYRLINEAVQSTEDMKAQLKRRYGFKRINLEEIVEEAILAALRDLEEHQAQSFLVQRLRQHKNPENQ